MMKKILLLLSFCFSLQASDVKLVWQTGASWELNWLEEVLEGVDFDVVHDHNFQKFYDRSIVVISTNKTKAGVEEYFEALKEKKYKFAVIHLSDENYNSPTSFYRDAEFVLRNYWHKKFEGLENVVTFPLGYKAGFWKEGKFESKPAHERKYSWSFAGQINGKPTRKAMISHLKVIPNHYIHQTHYWADKKQLSAEEYRDLLMDSIFSPSPMGWINNDSFRVCEGLECGCIPIVEYGSNDYFTNYFGPHPIPTVKSWSEAPAIMQALLDDPEALEQKRIECLEWWETYKTALKAQVAEMVHERLLL